MNRSRVFSDFNGLGALQGYLSLDCHGSIYDLSIQKVKLVSGLELTVYDDDDEDTVMEMDGIAVFLPDHDGWFARLDESTFRRVPKTPANSNMSTQLLCFHCGAPIDNEDYTDSRGYNFESRCRICHGLILESILPPGKETA